MSDRFAQINYKIDQSSPFSNAFDEWRELFEDALMEDGNFQEYWIFQKAENHTFGVSLQLDDNVMQLLHVGAAIGYINSRVDASELEYIERRMTINDD